MNSIDLFRCGGIAGYLAERRLIKRIMLKKIILPLNTTSVIGTQMWSLNCTLARATEIPANPKRNTSNMKTIVIPWAVLE